MQDAMLVPGIAGKTHDWLFRCFPIPTTIFYCVGQVSSQFWHLQGCNQVVKDSKGWLLDVTHFGEDNGICLLSYVLRRRMLHSALHVRSKQKQDLTSR